MKTAFITSFVCLVLVMASPAQSSGKLVVRNASDSYPTFIASLNGVRIQNTYSSSVTFAWLDDNVFRLRVFQYGGSQPLTFAVNCEANYVSTYMIIKDESGGYRIALESKILEAAQQNTLPAAPQVVASTTVQQATLAPAQQPTLAPPAPEPISNKDYTAMLAALKKEPFESNRLDLARNFFSNQHHSASQVAGMAKLFSFENNKLSFAKMAYAKTVDKQNYFKVFEVFSFGGSKQELSDYIQKNP